MPSGVYVRKSPPWNKGIVMADYPQCGFRPRNILGKENLGSKRTEESKIKMRKNRSKEARLRMNLDKIGKPLSDEHIRKILRKQPISSLEQKMLNIIQTNNLPYKFVGNGEFIIGGKCPDFVNTNGEKTAIEVFYKRHKEIFRNGLENWKQERQKIFNKYGWKIIYFDETQVNEENVKRGLK